MTTSMITTQNDSICQGSDQTSVADENIYRVDTSNAV